ncbi:RNA polymerase sigma factor [Paenibacillus protaetiae]|uniref:RNA polymerase sigma factor n=1 Tax=Paenibacillus protaetiae TaxID=2509456 RepID=A0A4P6EU02_9BACL|nr:RNA polymerase sigma factor [Paenibacillus protaetiae]QAY65945.1 RNA polymerase sigma factor [Paenibacillus protaetiae]
MMEEERRGRMEQLEDDVLAALAKTGDREAFGELVRRHRGQMYGYARAITREPYLAEDIVQDALIKAFLHMGTLADMGRFLPWLRQIVRNQAYTKLNSRPLKHEQPFTGLTAAAQEEKQEDWGDMESLLRKLSKQAVRPADELEPERKLARAELLELIEAMMRCLNGREKKVFEAYFFEQLSPQQIAGLFQLTTSNVYQLISRSRKKVAAEKARLLVDQYMNMRKDWTGMKTKLLDKKDILGQCAWTSAGAALYALVNYKESAFSLPAVMGYTSLAFRISISQGDVHIAGPTSYSFKDVLTRGLSQLGYQANVVSALKPVIGPNASLADPYLLTPSAKEKRQQQEELPQALELIHYAIDRDTRCCPGICLYRSLALFTVMTTMSGSCTRTNAANGIRFLTIIWDGDFWRICLCCRSLIETGGNRRIDSALHWSKSSVIITASRRQTVRLFTGLPPMKHG